MIDTRTAPYGIFGLRLVLGLLFLAHVGLKVFVFTPAGTAQFFGSLGLPPALAYVTIVWELVAAVALIVGVWPRLAALAGTVTLFGAIFAVHGHAGFFFNNPNGGWEYLALWIVALLVVTASGDGAYTLAATPVPGEKPEHRAAGRTA